MGQAPARSGCAAAALYTGDESLSAQHGARDVARRGHQRQLLHELVEVVDDPPARDQSVAKLVDVDSLKVHTTTRGRPRGWLRAVAPSPERELAAERSGHAPDEREPGAAERAVGLAAPIEANVARRPKPDLAEGP